MDPSAERYAVSTAWPCVTNPESKEESFTREWTSEVAPWAKSVLLLRRFSGAGVSRDAGHDDPREVVLHVR